MSVTSEINRIREVGNGSKTAFDFPFPVFSSSELRVYKVTRSTDSATLKTISTDYTVSISTTSEGGTVTFLVAPTSLEDSLIVRVLPFTQGAVLPTEGNFREDQIEQQLDRGVMRDIQLQEQIDRCIQVGVAEDTVDIDSLIEDVAEAAASATAAAASASAASSSASAASASASAAASSAASVPTLATILASVMPVGIVITLGVSTNPATLFGFGTWSAIAGRVIVGIDSGQTEFDTLDETGGAKTHTLDTTEIPAHTHVERWSGNDGTSSGNFMSNSNAAAGPSNSDISTGSTGGGLAHNNLQPYIVKYVWQRTA